MTNLQTIQTPQDYVNYTFNIQARGVAEASGELIGLSNTITNILGQIAFKTSEFLSHTEMLAIGAGAAISATFIKATQDAIRFEQQIANVKAIGGEGINANIIGDKAMEYSNKFGMATTSMTEGLEALARAGITTTNVMAGVLEEGVKLSKLEGIDLEESINDLISTTNLLSPTDIDMNAPEYAEQLKAMNQHIVSTSESAPINAQNIIQTLQHVGGYASAGGIDQDDLFAVIAQLGSRGTKGEMAGTALRAFIAAGQKDTAQRALARIGLDVSDLWNENGESMLSISEMKDVLDNALEARGYSKQEKLEFYSDFAGYKQANQIMKINTTEVGQYKEQIANAWDLGKKLDTILGTVRGNLDRIWQISQNFMTKVGGKMLKVASAILTPVRIALELFTKIPFADTGTAFLMMFVGLRTGLALFTKLVPALGGFISRSRDGKEYAKGIRGEWEKTTDQIKLSKEILGNLKDPHELTKIHYREQGLSAKNRAIIEDEVIGQMYMDSEMYRTTGIAWDQASPAFKDIVGAEFKQTDEFDKNYREYIKRTREEAAKAAENPIIIKDFEGKDNLEAINTYVQYIFNLLAGKRTRGTKDRTNSENDNSSPGNRERNRRARDFRLIGESILRNRQQYGNYNWKSSIDEMWDPVASTNIEELSRLQDKINQQIEQKIRDYNEFSSRNLNETGKARVEKSLTRTAMSPFGIAFSTYANTSDIRHYLETGERRSSTGQLFTEKQLKKAAEAMGISFGTNDIPTAEVIYNAYQARKSQDAELLDKISNATQRVWFEEQKNRTNVSYFPTQALRNHQDVAKKLMDLVGADSIEGVQSYFANNNDERMLTEATKIMADNHAFMDEIVRAEISYMYENLARVQNTIEDIQNQQNRGPRGHASVGKSTEQIINNYEKLKDTDYYLSQAGQLDLVGRPSQTSERLYMFEGYGSLNVGSQEYHRRNVMGSEDGLGNITINPGTIKFYADNDIDFDNGYGNLLLETIVHEMGHVLADHSIRESQAYKDFTGKGITDVYDPSQLNLGYDSGFVAEYEANYIAIKTLESLGLKASSMAYERMNGFKDVIEKHQLQGVDLELADSIVNTMLNNREMLLNYVTSLSTQFDMVAANTNEAEVKNSLRPVLMALQNTTQGTNFYNNPEYIRNPDNVAKLISDMAIDILSLNPEGTTDNNNLRQAILSKYAPIVGLRDAELAYDAAILYATPEAIGNFKEDVLKGFNKNDYIKPELNPDFVGEDNDDIINRWKNRYIKKYLSELEQSDIQDRRFFIYDDKEGVKSYDSLIHSQSGFMKDYLDYGYYGFHSVGNIEFLNHEGLWENKDISVKNAIFYLDNFFAQTSGSFANQILFHGGALNTNDQGFGQFNLRSLTYEEDIATRHSKNTGRYKQKVYVPEDVPLLLPTYNMLHHAWYAHEQEATVGIGQPYLERKRGSKENKDGVKKAEVILLGPNEQNQFLSSIGLKGHLNAGGQHQSNAIALLINARDSAERDGDNELAAAIQELIKERSTDMANSLQLINSIKNKKNRDRAKKALETAYANNDITKPIFDSWLYFKLGAGRKQYTTKLPLDTFYKHIEETYDKQTVLAAKEWIEKASQNTENLLAYNGTGMGTDITNIPEIINKWHDLRKQFAYYDTIDLPSGKKIKLPVHKQFEQHGYTYDADGNLVTKFAQKYMHKHSSNDPRAFEGIVDILDTDKIRKLSREDQEFLWKAILKGENRDMYDAVMNGEFDNPIFQKLMDSDGKLGEGWAALNITTAMDCMGRLEDGTCKFCDACYAYGQAAMLPEQAVKQVAKSLLFANTSVEDFVNILEKQNVKVLRFNQEGDFRDKADYEKTAEIARLAHERGLETQFYSYTKNKEVLEHIRKNGTPINYQMQDSLDESDPKKHGVANYRAAPWDDMLQSLKDGYRLCGGACEACEQCLRNFNKVTILRDGSDRKGLGVGVITKFLGGYHDEHSHRKHIEFFTAAKRYEQETGKRISFQGDNYVGRKFLEQIAKGATANDVIRNYYKEKAEKEATSLKGHQAKGKQTDSKESKLKVTGREMYDLTSAAYYYQGKLNDDPKRVAKKYFTPINKEIIKDKKMIDFFLEDELSNKKIFYISEEDYHALQQVKSTYDIGKYSKHKEINTYVPGYMPSRYQYDAKYIYDKENKRVIPIAEYLDEGVKSGTLQSDIFMPDGLLLPELKMLFDVHKKHGGLGAGYGYGTGTKNMDAFFSTLYSLIEESNRIGYNITGVKKILSSDSILNPHPTYLDEFLGTNKDRIHNYGIYYDPKEWGRLVNLLDENAVKTAFMEGYITKRQLKSWYKEYNRPGVLNDGTHYTDSMDNEIGFGKDKFGDLAYNMEMVEEWEKEKIEKAKNVEINRMERLEQKRQMFSSFMQNYVNAYNDIVKHFKDKKDAWYNSWFDLSSEEDKMDLERASLHGSPKSVPGQTSLDDFVTTQVETQTKAPNGAKTKPLEWGMPGLMPSVRWGLSNAQQMFSKNPLREDSIVENQNRLIKEFYQALDADNWDEVAKLLTQLSFINKDFDNYRATLEALNGIDDIMDLANISKNKRAIPNLYNYQAYRFTETFGDETKLEPLKQKARKEELLRQAKQGGPEDTTQTHNAPFVMNQQIRDFINKQTSNQSNTSTDQARTKREKENQYNIRWLLNSLVLTKGQRGLIQRLLMKGDNEAIVKEIKRSNAQVSDKGAKTVADYLINNPHELDKVRNDNFITFQTEEDLSTGRNAHVPIPDEKSPSGTSLYDSHFMGNDILKANAKTQEDIRKEVEKRINGNGQLLLPPGAAGPSEAEPFFKNWKRIEEDYDYYIRFLNENTTRAEKVLAETIRGAPLIDAVNKWYDDIASFYNEFLDEFVTFGVGGYAMFTPDGYNGTSYVHNIYRSRAFKNLDPIIMAQEQIDEMVGEFAAARMFAHADVLGSMANTSSVWEKTAKEIDNVTSYLGYFAGALEKVGEVITPLSIITTPLVRMIEKLRGVSQLANDIGYVTKVIKMLHNPSGMTLEEAKRFGLENEYKDAAIIKTILGNGPAAQELYSMLDDVTEVFTKYFDKGKDFIIQQAILPFAEFIMSNIAIIAPIVAGITAAVAGLWFMEKQHAKALQQTQEEIEELNSTTVANLATYKDLHKQRENETDALKRQQLARREAIALYELEVNGLKKLNAINKESQLKSDTLWGEYGMRAGWQRFTHGHNLLSGEFQSLYENYDGITKNIRQIREEVVGNLFATSAQREVAAYYDANILAFGEIEAFSKELNELYDKESQLIEEYGSIEAARETEEFNKAVQEFSDATRLNGETAVKYLDWLETENKVDKATQAMQVEVDMIVAEARRNMFAALYPDRDFNSATGIRDAMIYAQADQMIKDAYDQLWWDAFGNTLWGYFDLILYALNPADWVGELLGWENTHAKMAKKHFDAADAADKGLHELVENTDNIIKIGEEAADKADRRNYGTKSSIYNDEPFGFAISNAIYMEKNAISDGTKSIEDVLSYGMKKAGEEGVSSFKKGLNQHSPGDISNSVLDELVYSQNFIEALTPLLGESFALLGQEEVLKHNQGLGKDGDLPGHISGSISDELLHSQNFIETSTPLLNTSFSSLGQEEVLGHNQGLGKDGDLPGLIPKHTQQELDYTKNVLQENQEPIGQASYDLGYETGQQYVKGFKDGLNDLYEQVSTQEALSDTLKQKILYNQGLKTAPNKQSVPNDETKETAIESVADVSSFVLPKILRQLGEVVFKRLVKKGISKGLDELGEATGKTGLKTAGKTFTKIAPYIGPAVTAANAIYEHNPYEKHYNEDGSEKRALQATGEVVGETAGALAAMGLGLAVEGAVTAFTLNPLLGFIAGAGVEMVASLILEPIGEAIGGTIGWLADEIVNTPIKDIWGGFNDALGGIPGQIYDFIDQSPIGDLGHWAFNQLDSLTGGWLSSTWDYISNSSIASMAGDAWNQMSGAASSTWDWLSGAASNTWDWLSGAANNTWNWLFGGEEKSQSALNNGHNLLLTTDGMTVGPQWSAPPAEGLRGSLYEQIEGRKDPILGVFYTLRRLLYNNDKEPIYSKYDINKNGKVSYDSAKAAINKKTKDISTDNSKNTIVIKNININTEDDPEKIKTAFMNLMIELEEQITPRQVSRVVGEAPSASTNATADTDATNPNESTDPNDPNASTNPNDTSQNGTNNTNPTL